MLAGTCRIFRMHHDPGPSARELEARGVAALQWLGAGGFVVTAASTSFWKLISIEGSSVWEATGLRRTANRKTAIANANGTRLFVRHELTVDRLGFVK